MKALAYLYCAMLQVKATAKQLYPWLQNYKNFGLVVTNNRGANSTNYSISTYYKIHPI